MQVEIFTQRLKSFQNNLLELYQGASNGNEPTNSFVLSAFKELGLASEEMQVAVEELIIQVEELTAARRQLEAERQQYKNLFEFLPEAHLIIDLKGNILQANQATANLLKIEARFLKGKPLAIYIANSEKESFSQIIERLCQGDCDRKWTLELQPRYGTHLKVKISAFLEENNTFKNYPLVIHLIICEHDGDQQVKESSSISLAEFVEKRPKQTYQQRETISLEPTNILLVYRGWVKLTTIHDNGEEILIGLVGESMPFGSGMTSLQTYQAIALSEQVEIVSISWSELDNFSALKETLFSQLLQRFSQTESLLAISGTRQIQNRVYCFLLWLKENFGQPLPQGDRLNIRLTHQELANACCTSRVTITRVLGKLKKQGKISYDSGYHIILMK